MERQQVRKHVCNMCLYAVIPCKYKGIGCDTELKRQNMSNMTSSDPHDTGDCQLTNKVPLATYNTPQTQRETIAMQQVAIDSLQATVKSMEEKVDYI